MYIYTKCEMCGEEIRVVDGDLIRGMTINDEVYCSDCASRENESLIQSVCEKYGLERAKCFTSIYENELYVNYEIGRIDKEYWGMYEYSLVVNTHSKKVHIFKDAGYKDGDLTFELDGLTEQDVKETLKLIEFMCD